MFSRVCACAQYKYVTPNGKHGGVDTEWQTSELTTAYNAFVDA